MSATSPPHGDSSRFDRRDDQPYGAGAFIRLTLQDARSSLLRATRALREELDLLAASPQLLVEATALAGEIDDLANYLKVGIASTDNPLVRRIRRTSNTTEGK